MKTVFRGARRLLFGLFDLSDSTPMYYFSLAVFAIAFFLVKRIVNSPFGQVLKSIRENEPRAISLGMTSIDTTDCFTSRPAWLAWPVR